MIGNNESYEEEYEGRRVIITQTKVYKNKLLFVFCADDESFLFLLFHRVIYPCEFSKTPERLMIKNKQKRNKNFFKTFFSFFVCV
jgi:ATP/ADP translocase